jgi:hypothetical protein
LFNAFIKAALTQHGQRGRPSLEVVR